MYIKIDNVTLSDNTTVSAPVSWDNNSTPTYNSSAAGTYTFTGTITTPAGSTNSNNLKASVKVVVAPQTVPTTTGITAGKGLIRIMTGKPQYANVKIPFFIDSQSFSKNPTGYSFDVIYDPTKVGIVTVDSSNGLTKPTIGTPSPAADSSKEKVTVSWNGTLTGDYTSSKGILFKLNFIAKQDFTSGKTTAIPGELKQAAADAKEISNYISGKASTLKTLFGY